MKIKRFEFNMFPENCYVLWDETNYGAQNETYIEDCAERISNLVI